MCKFIKNKRQRKKLLLCKHFPTLHSVFLLIGASLAVIILDKSPSSSHLNLSHSSWWISSIRLSRKHPWTTNLQFSPTTFIVGGLRLGFGPLKDSQRLVLNPSQHCLGGFLWMMFMLKGPLNGVWLLSVTEKFDLHAASLISAALRGTIGSAAELTEATRC